ELKVGPRPGTSQMIAVRIEGGRSLGPKSQKFEYIYGILTDADGRFTIDRVVPGDGEVAREIRLYDDTTWVQRTYNEVKPGQAAHVTIGGQGRPVVGRIAVLDGAGIPDWTYSNNSLRQQRPDLVPARPPQGLGRAERTKWIVTWSQSKEGR